jgi:hypothetical protein
MKTGGLKSPKGTGENACASRVWKGEAAEIVKTVLRLLKGRFFLSEKPEANGKDKEFI